MITRSLTIPVSDALGTVSGEIMIPAGAICLYVFAHGAGAGMNHPFMVQLSTALAACRIATLRYNFPYMEKGGKRPDPPAVAAKTVAMAINAAMASFPGIPLIAGGKSFGGRMTSQYVSKNSQNMLKGIVFVGFPLHPVGSPGIERADHLGGINIPMLFLQGTRDALAEITLIEKVTADYESATLKKFEGADHSFKAGKQNLIKVLSETIRDWVITIV